MLTWSLIRSDFGIVTLLFAQIVQGYAERSSPLVLKYRASELITSARAACRS